MTADNTQEKEDVKELLSAEELKEYRGIKNRIAELEVQKRETQNVIDLLREGVEITNIEINNRRMAALRNKSNVNQQS